MSTGLHSIRLKDPRKNDYNQKKTIEKNPQSHREKVNVFLVIQGIVIGSKTRKNERKSANQFLYVVAENYYYL